VNKKLLLLVCNIVSLCSASQKRPEISLYIDECNIKNQRKTQEDFSACTIDIKKGELLLAVFDGHSGKEVALYMAQKVLEKFQYNLLCSLTEEQAFRKVFFECEEHAIENLKGGSTALVVYVNNGVAHIANVGDSRTVCGNTDEVLFATRDQTLAREDERNRVINAGGVIYRYKDPLDQQSGPWRINGLAMSRAIGGKWSKGKEVGREDVYLRAQQIIKIGMLETPFPLQQWPNIALLKGLECKPQIGQVIADPEYEKHVLTDKHRWLILATDGLWDDIANQEAINLVQLYYDQKKSLAGIAQILAQYAIRRGAEDNITVFVVDLFNLCKKRVIEVS